MAYSLDLRNRVVKYVLNGGKKSEASKIFNISYWCKRTDLSPSKPTGRPRKLNWDKLEEDIQKNPNKMLKERAKEFGVWINSIWYAKKKMRITVKKNS